MDGGGARCEVRGEAGYERSREERFSLLLTVRCWGRSDRGSGDVADGEWTRREPKLWTDGFGREGPTLVGWTDGHLNLKGLLHPCL